MGTISTPAATATTAPASAPASVLINGWESAEKSAVGTMHSIPAVPRAGWYQIELTAGLTVNVNSFVTHQLRIEGAVVGQMSLHGASATGSEAAQYCKVSVARAR